MIRKAFAVAAAVVGVVGLSHPAPVEATSHRAVRSFSAPWTLPYSAVEVTITATGYGGFGQVVETLPPEFGHQGSDLSEAAAAVEGQTVAFTLLGDERFTYTVAAPGRRVPTPSPESCWTRTGSSKRLAAIPASGSAPLPRPHRS